MGRISKNSTDDFISTALLEMNCDGKNNQRFYVFCVHNPDYASSG